MKEFMTCIGIACIILSIGGCDYLCAKAGVIREQTGQHSDTKGKQ